MYLLTVLDLCCCALTSSSCGGWGVLSSWVAQLCHSGASLVKHRLSSMGSLAVMHRLSCSVACGIFSLNQCHLQVDTQTLDHQGSPGSVQFSHSSMSDSLQPFGLQHLLVHHQLQEFTQIHVHWVSDTIQPSHPLSSPSPPAFNLSYHQESLFQWVSSLHQVAKVLKFQLQHQSFQWILRTDIL